jgi:N utilization substance protein A
MERTVAYKERRYIEELRILTGATAIDCIIDDRFDRLIYVIREGEMGPAIGHRGDHIRKLQKMLGTRIEMVEYAGDPEEFIAHIFHPVPVAVVRHPEDGSITLMVRRKGDLGIAIGKNGGNAEKARLLLRRFLAVELREIRAAGEG